MIIPITSKRTPPPPHQGTFNRPLTPAGLLLAVFAASLLLIACPSPGGGTGTDPSGGGGGGTTKPGGGNGGGTTTPAPAAYTTTVTGTVTASPPGESSSINLPGAAVSALTTPANPANQPAAAGPDGRFTLQVKHQGTFRLKVDHTCSEPFTTTDITAAADGSHDAGALQLTLGPEPADDTTRYSITEKSPGEYKLTVKECVREIRNREFSALGTIIIAKAAAESTDRFNMITEISLPSTLTKIGERAFNSNLKVRGTLTVPRNTAVIESRAFQLIGSLTPGSGDALNLVIQSDKLAKPGPDAARPFPLRDILIQNTSGIAGITLPPSVYNSYDKAELQAIFGSAFTNYRKPDGTAYDFSSKL